MLVQADRNFMTSKGSLSDKLKVCGFIGNCITNQLKVQKIGIFPHELHLLHKCSIESPKNFRETISDKRVRNLLDATISINYDGASGF